MTQQPPAQQHPMPQSPPPAPAPTGIVGAPAVPPATSFAATLGDAAAAPIAMPAPPPPAGPPAAIPAPADLGAAFPTLVQPAAPAAALDVTEPLAAPPAPLAPAMTTPVELAAAPAAPVDPAVPAAPAAPALEEPAAELARPTMEATLTTERPDAIGGVAAADSADLRELHARRASMPAPAADAASATGIWSPGIALIVATAALTLQLVAIYAREALPNVVASGQPLDQFDVLVRDLPLLDSKVASLGALLLGFAAVGIVLMGWKRGIRDVPLQAAVGIIGVLAILGATLVPALLG